MYLSFFTWIFQPISKKLSQQIENRKNLTFEGRKPWMERIMRVTDLFLKKKLPVAIFPVIFQFPTSFTIAKTIRLCNPHLPLPRRTLPPNFNGPCQTKWNTIGVSFKKWPYYAIISFCILGVHRLEESLNLHQSKFLSKCRFLDCLLVMSSSWNFQSWPEPSQAKPEGCDSSRAWASQF